MNKRRLKTLNSLRYSLQNQILTLPWNDISVQLISKEAKVSIGTFYNYFDGKDEALLDLKIELTRLLKHDLLSLLATYSSPIDKIVITVKYILSLSAAESTWSNYLYSGGSFSDRLVSGIQDILCELIVEGIEEGIIGSMDVPNTIHFIEAGVFTFAKNAYLTKCDDTFIVDLVLRTLGVSENVRNKALNMICPVTPLISLPIPILKTAVCESVYE